MLWRIYITKDTDSESNTIISKDSLFLGCVCLTKNTSVLFFLHGVYIYFLGVSVLLKILAFCFFSMVFIYICVFLTLSAMSTKTDTFANSVDPAETAHNEPSYQDLHDLPACSWFTPHNCYHFSSNWFVQMQGRVYFRNLGSKGLKLGRFSYCVITNKNHMSFKLHCVG